MRVALYIPFWGEDSTRLQALRDISDKVADMYPWDYFGLIGEHSKHRGTARNDAMRYARIWDYDVAVVLDADSYPQATPLYAAIEAAADEGIHFPHNRVQTLGKNGLPNQRPYGPSAGGCWVARPDEWFRVGGMEERGGWSVDDRTFLCQMKTFGGGPYYHQGVLTCLWHAVHGRTVPPEDTALIQRYLDAEGDPGAMRALLAERP